MSKSAKLNFVRIVHIQLSLKFEPLSEHKFQLHNDKYARYLGLETGKSLQNRRNISFAVRKSYPIYLYLCI